MANEKRFMIVCPVGSSLMIYRDLDRNNLFKVLPDKHGYIPEIMDFLDDADIGIDMSIRVENADFMIQYLIIRTE
jgi:hypothetical protein